MMDQEWAQHRGRRAVAPVQARPAHDGGRDRAGRRTGCERTSPGRRQRAWLRRSTCWRSTRGRPPPAAWCSMRPGNAVLATCAQARPHAGPTRRTAGWSTIRTRSGATCSSHGARRDGRSRGADPGGGHRQPARDGGAVGPCVWRGRAPGHRVAGPPHRQPPVPGCGQDGRGAAGAGAHRLAARPVFLGHQAGNGCWRRSPAARPRRARRAGCSARSTASCCGG